MINFVLIINKLKTIHSKLTKISKEQIETLILPLLPKNKRGFKSRFNPIAIIQSIIHKLKTGCQWRNLFADIEGVKSIWRRKMIPNIKENKRNRKKINQV